MTLTADTEIDVDDGTGAKVSLTSEALAGGSGGFLSVSAVMQLPRFNDDAVRRFGDKLWDRVDKDSRAGASVDTLMYTALANDLAVIPVFEPEPGVTADGVTPEEQADFDNSRMAADYVAATLDNLSTPVHPAVFQYARSALKYGAAVADKVWAVEPVEGEEFLQLVLKAFKPKDRRAWIFEVDPAFNLIYLKGASYDPVRGVAENWLRWPREKFAVMTWGGLGGDPRGESVYSRAVEPWNLRVQIPALRYKFLQRFGTPNVSGNLSESSVRGISAAHREAKPFEWFRDQLLKFFNHEVIALGKDDAVTVHEVQTEGHAFEAAEDYYGREITVAVLLQTRATMEAKHGSRADSGTGQDILGNIVRFLRRLICQVLETDVAYHIVAYRWGEDFAKKYTPGISLGEVEHQDLNAVLQGLSFCGYTFDPSQFAALDKFLGLTNPRDPAEMSDEGADVLDYGQARDDSDQPPDAGKQDAVKPPAGGKAAARQRVYTRSRWDRGVYAA